MLITNFASGELSHTLNGRTDIQQYYQAASYMNNFEIIPTGGIKRRTGFKRMGELHGKCRLIPFIVNSLRSYILEVCEDYIYVWKNGAPLLDLNSNQVKIASPYGNMDDINELHYAQNYDELHIVHKNYNPRRLSINEDLGEVEITEIGYNFTPDVKIDDDYHVFYENKEDTNPTVTIINGHPAIEGDEYLHGLYTCTKGKMYHYNETSREWEAYKQDSEPSINYNLFTTENNRPRSVTFYNNRIWYASTVNNPQKVWASSAPDTEGSRYKDFNTYVKYITVSKVVKDPDLHIFSGTIKTTSKNVIEAVTQDFTIEGALQEDATSYYVSGDIIPAGTKVTAITATTITLSQEANISEDTTGYEFSIQLWKDAEAASADDYEYTVTSNNITTSDCSLNFELASEENDAIKFISANRNLIIGTESTVWAVPSSITALNIVAENQGRYGSSEIQAISIDQATVFFAQGKKGIREFYYDTEADAFRTNNIAIMAEQMLTESAAKDFDYVNNPYNKLVITREDGTIAILLYDKNNGVMAWHRYSHGEGSFYSTAITLGDEQNDYFYCAVKYGSGDDASYFLEMTDSNNEVYLDNWKTYDGSLGSTDGYTDNAILFNVTKDKTCSITSIPDDFYTSGDEVYIGYKYESDIISMPVIANDPTGKKRITALLIRFLESYFPEIKCTGVDNENFYGSDAPYSGIKTITYPGSSERDVYFEISVTDPRPVNILSVNATLAS